MSNEKAQQDTISQTDQPKLSQMERSPDENRSMGSGQTERRPSPPRMPLFRR